MLTESKKKFREWCLRTYRSYKLSKFTENVSLHNFFSIEDYKLLSSRKKDYGKDLAERFLSTIDYIRILLREEVTDDYGNLINKVADSLKTYAGVELSTNHSKIIEDIKKDKELAIRLITNENPREDLTETFLNSVRLVFSYMNEAFNHEGSLEFDECLQRLYKNKHKLAVFDYYFDCLCSIDEVSWLYLVFNLMGLCRPQDNETDEDRFSRIDANVEKIYTNVCDSLAIEKKMPSLNALNRLPYLLKLSQVTKRDYDNIKILYKDKKSTDIFNSVMEKIERQDNDYKEKKVEYSVRKSSNVYETLLNYEYFKLYKILVPLSLLSARGRRSFMVFVRNEFNTGYVPKFTRELEDWE